MRSNEKDFTQNKIYIYVIKGIKTIVQYLKLFP